MKMLDEVLSVRSVPPKILVMTALASYGGLIFAAAAGWPLWGMVAAATGPWAFVFLAETRWTWRNFGWLALFYVLTVSQLGHFVEHLVQMYQIHVQHLTGPAARGVFGQLDIEWVHFIWNTWILVAVVVLLTKYPKNPWLWVSLVAGGWHEIEHAYIMSQYLGEYGKPGNPGLLSRGGAFGGGLDISRPDLHFIYNLIETLPIVLAFAWQLRHTYNEWIAQALPGASTDVLVDASEKASSLRFPAGQPIISQGDPADGFYIVVRGTAEAIRMDDDGTVHRLRRLGPGEHFGEIGLLHNEPRSATVIAVTDVDVLLLERSVFGDVIRRSAEANDAVSSVADARRVNDAALAT